jgi:hypothetical protein
LRGAGSPAIQRGAGNNAAKSRAPCRAASRSITASVERPLDVERAVHQFDEANGIMTDA